ncbi:hypothetical protein GCM10011380_00050 [Sphingomonas metalli]|uniref:Uncharacterized protein n=1 Tax=Sphingomonas metalli TaxID=1779358 RepID=A0A916WNI7_9SPHN|nr:hypothetical protein [Sphingomonas metalli]GGB14658.1 hypothetical protein GCM10011380_00050 [Sphingomonas metalli]
MKIAVPLLLVPLLAACARDATVYPSLAKRPIEAMDLSKPPESAPATIVPDPALDAKIATLTRRLAALKSGFDTDAARAETLARAGGARTVGSEAWLTAQTGLAALDDWRAQTSTLVGEADDAARTRATALQPPYPALEALQAAIGAESARQNDAARRIQALLPGA